MLCAAEGCETTATLRCPTCVKQEAYQTMPEISYFCSQSCFKQTWPAHKQHHISKQNDQIRALATNSRLRSMSFQNYHFTGSLRPAHVSLPRRHVPTSIPAPDYAVSGLPAAEERFNRTATTFDTPDVDGMRAACRVARLALDAGVRVARVGGSTEQVDKAVHEKCIEEGGYPSPLNYYGFPKSCCTSVNEVVCHGIPDARLLQDGDILNVDVTVYYKGFHGDVNETICIGDNVKRNTKNLIKAAHDSMWAAIEKVKPGTLVRELGGYTEKVAKRQGMSVVRSYCGHGIGSEFHTAPNVAHYRKNKTVGICKKGMCFTIEPMLNEGGHGDELWPDQWTAVTADGSMSAQFEHTVLVTEDGVEVLTARLADSPCLWWEEEAKQELEGGIE